ncbi:dihydroxy-acid dehydratase, partial [Desulfocurvibacter africanus]
EIDIPARRISLLVDDAELEARRKSMPLVRKEITSPLLRRYARQVTSAAQGAVLSAE